MTDSNDTIRLLAERCWDVVVVGTGMGGATLGYALAQTGKSVLFCERGASHLDSGEAITGGYPEQQSRSAVSTAHSDALGRLRRGGRYTGIVSDESGGRRIDFVPFIGSGTGGSSALYGMALERFSPIDFEPGAAHAGAIDSSLEPAWPVTYDQLEPYYAAAEALYRVRGGADPLRPAPAKHVAQRPDMPALEPQADRLFRHLQGRGLHPYRLPLACESVAGCRSCQGFLCPNPCKNDSARVCLAPALADHDARLLSDTAVVEIEADHRRVTGLVCERHGERFRLQATTVVLAAGALQTPNLLLRSVSRHWPDGLGNSSGMVGRNLMRHYVDLYAVGVGDEAPSDFDNRYKGFAFNDFYVTPQAKLGSVQAFGRLPPVPMLMDSMRDDLASGPLRLLGRLLPLASPLLKPVLGGIVDRTLMLATIVEDLPYADNRVLPARQAGRRDVDIRLAYRVRDSEGQRIRIMRRLMAEVLSSRRWRLIKQAHNNQRIAHVCGTCRFGADPKTSVLDRRNRVHELDNLYVADASFFPSSGGTNPSLTIAANALRVADELKSV